MTPVTCAVTHAPPSSYGDCLRACIATIMDLPAEDVPHFADKGASAAEALAHARQWLGEQGLTIATFALPGSEPLSDVLEWMGHMNPTVTWLLFGSTTHPDVLEAASLHVNVCQGGKVVHDPAWVPTSIKSPYREGGESVWQIWVVCRT